MVRCANCGFENREAARFCKNCGKPLSAAASADQPDTVAPSSAPPAPDPTPAETTVPVEGVGSREWGVGAPDPAPTETTARGDDAPNERAKIEEPDDGIRMPPPYEWHAEQATNRAPDAEARADGELDDKIGDEIDDERAAAEPIERAAASQQQSQQHAAAQTVEAEIGPEVEAEVEVAAEEEVTPATEIEALTIAPDAPQETAEARPAFSAAPRRPLARGTLIADRFLIVGIDAYDNEPTIYTVEDRGICPSCGAKVAASEEEPFCSECGANLLSEAAGRKIFELREIAQAGDGSEEDRPDGVLVWHGRQFEYVKPMHLVADGDEDAEARSAGKEFKAGVNLMVGQRSDVGVARAGRPDEDSVFALTMTGIYDTAAGPTFGLYIVCDGMGGHGDGEIASRIAAKTISTYLIQTLLLPLLQGAELKPDAITANVSAAVQLANRHVVDDSVIRSNDMGTTLTMAVVIDRNVYVANVGDSRTYLWNETGLHRLTEDHSVVFQMVQEGALPEEAVYTHPARSQINRSLGMPGPIEVDHFHAELTPGSVLVLCCDGLWEVLRNDGIADVLMMGMHDPQTICDTMIRHANEAGGPDNISVIVVRAST